MPRTAQSPSSKRVKAGQAATFGNGSTAGKKAKPATAPRQPVVKANGSAAVKAKKPGAKKPGTEKLYEVRRSKIHGRGVFAAASIRKGTRIIEYKGKRISYKLACRLYPDVEGKPTHTFLFEIDDDTVIDAAQNGNAARWINHSCEPNCEAVDEDGRIYIEAIRHIRAGEELGYNYGITLDERHTPAAKKRWPCHCGKKSCRGTLLMPKH